MVVLHYSNIYSIKKTKPTHLLHLFLLFSLFSITFSFAFLLFSTSTSTCLFFYQFIKDKDATISCDRAAFRTDICYMKGSIVRTHSNSSTVFLYSNNVTQIYSTPEEKIRPYPRKWESSIMSEIPEIRLKLTHQETHCDVVHSVPAVVFSTGGYTGNVFHEFNEGIVPLYVTSQQFNRNVAFVVLQYKNWWVSKYRDVLSRLSKFDPIDFYNDTRSHCFSEAIVGLNIHEDLSIDAGRMGDNGSILGFRKMLDEAYRPRIRSIEMEEEEEEEGKNGTERVQEVQKPKLVILSRNGSRAIENEEKMANLAEEIGFRVKILRPYRTTELAKIYRELNSSEAMIGVHGAAMTHFLFMRPGSVFIQIVPLGTEWAAETFYGEPATRLGLRYLGYKIHPVESSLYREHEEDDPILKDPKVVNARGWEATKKVYLDAQNVRLDLERFRVHLDRAYWYLISRKVI